LCTTDDCHPHYGGCINNPANCRDWDDCTENNCNPLDGVCDFTTPAEDGTSCIGDFDGLARIGMCRAGVCVPPCDPESEEILQCPRKRGEDQFCCPGCELCNRSCEDIFRCLVSDGEGGSGGTGGTGGTGGVGGAGGAGGSAGWTCPDENYGAADGCHCGCGVIDPDCADGTVASCDTCDGPGSCSGGLGCPGDIDHAQNWICGG
jgi:hypothetical protein